MISSFKEFLRTYYEQIKASFKLILFSIAAGCIVGLVGIALYYATNWANLTRAAHPQLIFALPLAGLLIVFLYRTVHKDKDQGTNLVIQAIQSEQHVPIHVAPLIIAATTITHLFGGSAGREAAALQVGGSIASFLGKILHFNESDRHIMIMCGMSASFSAVFGTPIAAAVFSLELVSVGIMQYSALVPCVIASLVAHGLAVTMGCSAESFEIVSIPDFNIQNAFLIGVLALLCALVSILFCIVLHNAEKIASGKIKNTYLRIVIGGAIVLGATLILGSQNFNGPGMHMISQFVEQQSAHPYDFAVKMILTAITLSCGFKGGEIVPSFFIGASFGCAFGNLIGFSPSLCAAVGLGAVFCGMTNCPITSLLICMELFGFKGIPFFLLAISLSYMMSGYYGLYHSQKIIYSKYRDAYINRKTY